MNDETKKRPVWVQLELFPEMKAAKAWGGENQSVTNQNNTALMMKHRVTVLAI